MLYGMGVHTGVVQASPRSGRQGRPAGHERPVTSSGDLPPPALCLSGPYSRIPTFPLSRQGGRTGRWQGRSRCADEKKRARQPGLQAGDRSRTGDLQLGKLTLYQLSYARNATPSEHSSDTFCAGGAKSTELRPQCCVSSLSRSADRRSNDRSSDETQLVYSSHHTSGAGGT